MSNIQNDIENLKTTYQKLKNDFIARNQDLYLLKKQSQFLLEATSNYKMSETIDTSDFAQKELVELLTKIRNLISAIEKEIEIQTQEEYFDLNNNEI